jgi:hypothetical protein
MKWNRDTVKIREACVQLTTHYKLKLNDTWLWFSEKEYYIQYLLFAYTRIIIFRKWELP